jgi:hypothetical protein
MLAPPLFTLPEARAAMREIHDQHVVDFYALKRGEERATASTFRTDIGKNSALWRRLGFAVLDGPFATLQQAKFEIALDRAYSRAHHGLLGRS